MNKILIPGGSGFVGSSLALGLKQRHPDWQIIVLDNLRRRGSELNLARFQQHDIEFLHGDIRQEADLDPESLKSVNLIIDCSAEPSVLAGFSSPQYVLQTNLLGTINLLELARKIQAQFLFLSTSRVYPIEPLKKLNLVETATRLTLAPQQELPGISELGIAEEFPLNGARSLYGATKLASELLIVEYRDAYQLPAIINRCGVIAGPWQMGKVDQGVFTLWVAAHHFQKELSYIGYGGTGKQVRDVLHIDDLLDLVDYQIANFAALDGDILNVGGGLKNSLSLLETTQLCEEITGAKIKIQPVSSARKGDVPLYLTDTTKIQAKTPWQPQRNPQTVLADIFHWLVANEQFLKPILG
ncbi:MAG: NAD-dependent epimerase/dehydratase family protein [Jaaginema sp. PMC 1079.18]|nr:NAD-dependent epimerase/dehydratase family protein [Jaaginema sp. PMC 1080.18]MEC4850180.1 NAD-dependent epimerase/dehydratase family protein [Jaaginema sp. PMC 1079.18]MEC4866775.1 NAD-dependent epimerase/dehydratase family protein [Jaaginema sp. PMC 1078.18]